MKKILLENINSVPNLPESIQEIERISQDPDSTFIDMKKAIEKDPLLMANILRLVNSPMLGMSRKISTVEQAISLLGKDTVRTFVWMSTVESAFTINLSPYNVTLTEFTNASNKKLTLMLHWLMKNNAKSLSKLAPATFLVDIGRIIIVKTLIDGNAVDAFTSALENLEGVDSAEISICGYKTTDVTASLLKRWKLVPDIIHLIRYSDDPDGANENEQKMAAQLKAVREAVTIQGEISEESIITAKDTIMTFKLDMEGFEEALSKMMNS